MLTKFRREQCGANPTMRVETLLMALDGTVLEIT